MNNPYVWLQDFIEQVPVILQPILVAVAGAIPYIEGEGAAAFGIIAGINPLLAAVAGATGNILCVLAVVLLGSRIRGRVVMRRAARIETTRVGVAVGGSWNGTESGTVLPKIAKVTKLEPSSNEQEAKSTGRAKGRARLRLWMVKFGVPGASILAPLALPTMLTAAFFVASGVPKQWVILWQVVAIVLWTSAVAIAATGALALIGW
ncbi:hypothetical protein MB46_07010 [Arthrobacter alpinus]|uniref:hypothetical protein n=1 Tax=Arthrobacter alpinus TaxID=656366 RepID=UPI0005CAD1EC|nr:hypothetical protein [Arthrobacter alpinus]ALV45281.1 hypothetical protein MB46_07010 [Arthrobacter alpinus]